MAAKTFYFKNAVPTGATLHRSLQDGGTAPTAATTTTGWNAGTNASAQSCLQKGGTEVARGDATWGATLKPSATVSQTVGDCWRSENTITGKFANTDWTFNFGFRSVTAAYAGRLKLAVRLYRSTNANGTGATEITAARVVSAATTANLSTTVDTTLSWTWTPGATHTFTAEYLFVQVGIEITSAGSATNQDFDFRVASTYTVVTPNFVLNYGLTCNVGAYTYTGVAATLGVHRNNVLTCAVGAYTYSGTTTAFALSRKLACAVGAYTYTGNAATLTYTPGSSTVNYTLTCAVGAYAYSGNAATLTKEVGLLCNAGAYTYTGNTATLTYAIGTVSYTLVCDAGSYTYTGQPATLTYSGAVVGRLKYWNGSSWVLKTLKTWDGSAWVTKTLKARGASTWI